MGMRMFLRKSGKSQRYVLSKILQTRRFEISLFTLRDLAPLNYSGTCSGTVNGHLYTTDTSEQRTNIFAPNTLWQNVTPPYSGHLSTTDEKIGPIGVRYMEVPLYFDSSGLNTKIMSYPPS